MIDGDGDSTHIKAVKVHCITVNLSRTYNHYRKWNEWNVVAQMVITLLWMPFFIVPTQQSPSTRPTLIIYYTQCTCVYVLFGL